MKPKSKTKPETKIKQPEELNFFIGNEILCLQHPPGKLYALLRRLGLEYEAKITWCG
jgi:hypothetical protein